MEISVIFEAKFLEIPKAFKYVFSDSDTDFEFNILKNYLISHFNFNMQFKVF